MSSPQPTTTAGAHAYTNQTNFNVGTSFSAPIVSGIVGLMASVNGNLGTVQLIARLKEGATTPFPVSPDVTIPMCHVPTGPNDIQASECNCTNDNQTCGAGMADAFSRWLEHVLGPRGLVVFDSSDPAAKPLVAGVFAREIENPGEASRLAAEAGSALTARGYHAQVTPGEGSLALFHMNAGREPIKVSSGGFQVGDGTQSKSALLERIRTHPAEFSPNVLLRPVVQDTLFPTVCYVAGPSELAYLGQLRRVYAAFDVPMPLVQQRATATIVDSNAMRFLSKHDVSIEVLRAQDEAALNELLIAQLPTSVEVAMQTAGDAIEQRMDALAREVPRIDATLEGATRSTLSRMQDDLKKLHAKIVQAAKRKDETLRRQFHHAQAQAFPGGHPQEREIGFVTFLNKYGPGVIDRLLEALPAEMGTHWVITV